MSLALRDTVREGVYDLAEPQKLDQVIKLN